VQNLDAGYSACHGARMGQRVTDELAIISGLEREIEARWENIGVLLYTARRRAGLGLRDVARRAGLDHGHLSRAEKGTKRISHGRLGDLIRVLEDEI